MEHIPGSMCWRQIVFRVILCGLAVVLSSCFEERQAYELNPDGSGRVRYEVVFTSPPSMLFFPIENLQRGGALGAGLTRMIAESEGVDAWQDVVAVKMADGRFRIAGTAYFSDLNTLDIGGVQAVHYRFATDAKGVHEIKVTMDGEGDGQAFKVGAKEPPQPSGKRHADLSNRRTVFGMVLSGLKHRATFRMNGRVSPQGAFEQAEDGAVAFSIIGEEFLEAGDEMVAAAEEGADEALRSATASDLLGQVEKRKGRMVLAVGASAGRLLDYKAELASAREQEHRVKAVLDRFPYRRFLHTISYEGAVEADPVTDLSVRSVDPADPAELHSGPGLVVTGKLPLAPLSHRVMSWEEIDKRKQPLSCLRSVVAADGKKMLVYFNEGIETFISEGKREFSMTIDLGPQAVGEQVFAEIRGIVRFRAAEAVGTTLLGIDRLEAGFSGVRLGAVLESLERPSYRRRHAKLRLKLAEDQELISVKAVIGTAKRMLKIFKQDSGPVTLVKLEIPDDISRIDDLLVETHDGILTREAPFLIRDVRLEALEGTETAEKTTKFTEGE